MTSTAATGSSARTTPVEQPGVTWMETVGALVEMTKYRLSSLVVVTAGAGFVLAPGPVDWLGFTLAMLGTVLAAFGANAFNQCLESKRDINMDRTRDRALPSGRVSLPLAVLWSLSLLFGGVAILALSANALAAGLALLVGVLYVGAYTPLKPRTSLNTLIGAVCGAIPPMIGWVAASGAIAMGAWVLFGILFAWQIPHFLAIDWFHRDDYARGGFCMASSVDRSGQFSAHQAVLYSLVLIPISILAPAAGIGGPLYLVGALVLGTGFLGLSIVLYVQRTRLAARRLFFGSLAYLPLLLALLVLDPTSA